jgi:hypothetical protein
MKTKSFILLLLINVLLTAISAQEKQSLTPISKIVVSNGIQLQIERSPDYTISFKTQDLDESCLIKTIESGVLTLKLVSSINCKGKVIVNITCPTIKELEVMGNADVSSRNVITGDSIKLTLKSGGKAYLDLDIKNLETHMTEGSLLSASGYAVRQKVFVSSNATYSCFGLEGEYVTVESTLAGKAKVCASTELIAITKTGGYIGYKCNPASKTLEPKGNGVIQQVTED